MVLINSRAEAKLDFDRLATITEKLEAAGFHNYPIVLHGASSVDQRCVAMCNEYGGNIAGAKGFLRKCCVRHLPWLSAKSTWILT